MNNDSRFRLGDDGELVPIGEEQFDYSESRHAEKPKHKNTHGVNSLPSAQSEQDNKGLKVVLVFVVLIIITVVFVQSQSRSMTNTSQLMFRSCCSAID